MPPCKSCGQELLWVKSSSGKNIPLNAEPIKKVWTENKKTQTWYFSDEAYVSHFATCPNADQFRKGDENKPPQPQSGGSKFDDTVKAQAPATTVAPSDADDGEEGLPF